nr:MAG TPA: ATP-grasp domain protein [Caudoviricetes sp.]
MITKIAPQLRGLFMVDVDAMWTVVDINPFISSG